MNLKGPDISSSIDQNQLKELINLSNRIPIQLKATKISYSKKGGNKKVCICLCS